MFSQETSLLPSKFAHTTNLTWLFLFGLMSFNVQCTNLRVSSWSWYKSNTFLAVLRHIGFPQNTLINSDCQLFCYVFIFLVTFTMYTIYFPGVNKLQRQGVATL